MVRLLVSIFVFAFVLASCSSSVQKEETEKSPNIEIHEAKKFVLGKWLYKEVLPDLKKPWQKKINERLEKTKPPILYLIFRDDNVLVFVNCMPLECEENELPYKINESGFIEIDARGVTPLIVKKLGEDEIELVNKSGGGLISPPLIYFFRRWTRVRE
jgi:hypothetical protein